MREIEILKALANVQESDDLSVFTAEAGISGNPLLKEAIETALLREKESAANDAAQVILDCLKSGQATMETLVARVRDLRRSEQETMARIRKLDRAMKYGRETGNWFPVLMINNEGKMLNQIEIRRGSDGKHEVPADWVPKDEKEQSKKSKK